MPNTPALIGKGISGRVRGAVGRRGRPRARLVGPRRRRRADLGRRRSDARRRHGGVRQRARVRLLLPRGARSRRAGSRLRARRMRAASPRRPSPAPSRWRRRATPEPATLRAQVTSKGGTTERAIASLEAAAVKASIVAAVKAAAQRAAEMGDAFGVDGLAVSSTCSSPRIRLLLDTAFGLITYSFLLRFAMQWLRAPFRNPLGQAVVALTDWAVKPVRRSGAGLQGHRRLDAGARLGQPSSRGSARSRCSLGPARRSTARCWRRSRSSPASSSSRRSLWLLDHRRDRAGDPVVGRARRPLRRRAQCDDVPVPGPDPARVPPVGGTLDLSPLILIVALQLVLMLPVRWLEGAVLHAVPVTR